MINPAQIPDEVVEAATKADYEHHFRHSCKKWPEDCYEKEREGWRVSQRLAIAAALNAWPGCRTETEWFTSSGDYWEPAIILPLPTGDGQ